MSALVDPAAPPPSSAERCLFCRNTPNLPPEDVLYRDEHWTVFHSKQLSWAIIITLNRHADFIWGLDPEEAAGLGDLLVRVGKAVRDEWSPDAVYVISLGEIAPHFHLELIPRSLEIFEGIHNLAIDTSRKLVAGHEHEVARAVANIKTRLSG